MQAEVIAIGDELTGGQRLDTNSQWLSQQLGEIGIRTLFHTTVADDLAANIHAFRQAAQRVDLIVCTGGLGPTADDLTRQSIGEAFDLSLVLHQESLDRIRQMFESRGREMPERNRVQAQFPEGSQPVHNPHGTAPGIDLSVAADHHRCRIFCLPGVPAEMKEMWEQTVGPLLQLQLGNNMQVVRHFRLKCFGMGESALEAMLPDLIRRGREPSVGITVSQATITLRVTVLGRSDEACRELMQPTIEIIRTCLGNLVFGEEDDELQHAVTRALLERNESVAICEWGSGGLMSDWMHTVSGSERVFAGAKVVTSFQSAHRLLGVDPSLEPCDHAKMMAATVRESSGAHYAISIGAFPKSVGNAEAQVFLGLATRDGVSVVGRRFAGHPNIRKPLVAKQALDLLRLHLLGS